MLVKRIISSIILITIIALAVIIDWHGLLRVSLCGLVITFFIITGLYEFFTMLQHKGIKIYKYFGISMGAIIPISIVFRFELTKNWELLFIVVALLSLIVMQFRRRDNVGVIVDISTTIFGILYVSWFFSFLIKIIYLHRGMALLTCVLLSTKLGDIGAYLIGSRFGKTPLIPRISPKKSIEGSIGGLLFAVSGAVVSNIFLNFNYLHIIFIGFSLGVLGQLGDLSESLMKRDCQVKDSGRVFPGLGGALDTIDSLLFSAPAFYFYMSTILK